MSATRGWACLCVLAAAGTLTLAQNTQPPTFKTGVHVVRIDVSVLDGKRQPVRGLQASDFTVLEDGQPRPIRSFQAVEAAAAKPAMTPLPAHNVATNQVGGDTSRLIFILMDRSIPAERPMIMARQIADAAVDAMGPGDLAAIVSTGGGVPQNLTSDRARLHKTIAAADWSHRLSQAQLDDPIVGQVLGMGDALGDPSCMCGLCVMDTIARIANDVRDVPRRKVLLFVGSNLIVQAGPRAFSQDVGCEKRVADARERLYDALGTSGLTVHSIDPQGLASVGPATRASQPGSIEINAQLTKETMEFMGAQGNLGILPELTGGRTILNTNEPFRMVPALLHESDAYYLLAFEPIEIRGEVRHSIEVKVARKGVRVQTARYLAPSSTARAASDTAPATATATRIAAPASPLESALTGLLPDTSRPLGMSVAAFAGPDRDHAYVGVTLDASAFVDRSGSIPLEIGLLASDARGRRAGSAHQTGSVEIPEGARAALVELQTYLTLPPGDFELRAAVMNPGTRATASVFTHVSVPAFDAAPMTLSDIVLGTRQDTSALPDGAPRLPIVPTTVRSIGPGQMVSAFLRVYRGSTPGGGFGIPVSLEAIVLDGNGKRLETHALPDASFTGGVADVRMLVPLNGLRPGRYALRIVARQQRSELAREVPFTVVAPSLTTEHSAALDGALAAAAGYLDAYERRISAISAEEDYEQAVQRPGGTIVSPGIFGRGAARGASPPTATETRKTRSHLMTIALGARGWVSFRDVFELDGRVVRDGPDRLIRILQTVSPESLEQARQIADESARYNLAPEGTRVDRTLNVPMTALHFLRGANQSHSVFTLGKSERVGGVECVTLHFVEQGRPRLIMTRDDAPAEGTFWIDLAAGGRVLKSELHLNSAAGAGVVQSRTTVTYARVEKLDLWLPTIMDDAFVLPAGPQVTGHATYSDFREFKVTTSEDIK